MAPARISRRWFQLIALSTPFGLVLLFELALRVFGFGFPTCFFFGVFFERFTEKSSSFFAVLSFLPAGFSSSFV